jgi:uncharacterized protein involved in exopolysaccharide biosynthesis
MTPVYKASCIIALGNYGDPINTNDITVKELMLSDEYLLEVIDTLNLDVPPEKFEDFKGSIEITKNITGNIFEISIETPDQQNATAILTQIVSTSLNHSEESYSKYNKSLSDKLAITQRNLDVLDRDINQTREVLRNIGKLPGITQEQLELSHSRTLENLQNAESRRASLLDQYLELKRQSDFMENIRVLLISEEPMQPISSHKIRYVAIAGILGLMIGIFAAFLREGRGRPAE